MWLLDVFIDGAKAVWDFIVTAFTTLLDAVLGLALLPILGPINLLISAILTLVCGITDAIANGMISIMTYNQFGDRSFFEILFYGSSETFAMLQAFAFALLFMIYLFQLIKAMVSPPGEAYDEPITLTFRTIAAGCLIVFAHRIIKIAFKFFGTFYMFFAGQQFKVSFAKMSEDARDLITTDLPTIGARAQLLTLIGMIFLLIMTVVIAKSVVRYSIEMTLRFTIVGVMVVTAPLGATLYASKSTRNSFNAWVRMIVSQLVLICFGVVFLRIFCTAFKRFSTAFEKIQDVSSIGNFSTLLLWTLMINAILIVGLNVDSFLKSLGLSVAECGGAMSTAILAEGQMFIAATANSVSAAVSFATGNAQDVPIFRTMSNIAGTASSATQAIARIVRGDTATAQAIANSVIAPRTVDEINRAVPPVFAGKAMGAMTEKHALTTEGGRNICNEMRGVPNRLKQTIDRGQFKIENGVLLGRTTPDTKGNSTGLIFVPTQSVRNSQQHNHPTQGTPSRGNPITGLASKSDLEKIQPGGREVMIGGQSYMMYAAGTASRAFMVDDVRAKKEFRQMGEESGAKIFECKDADGEPTGIYMQKIHNSDGSMTKRFWAPTSRYTADASLGAVNVAIGGLTYAQYDVRYGFSPDGKFKIKEPKKFDSWTAAGKVDWFKQNFPAYKDASVQDVEYGLGVYAATIDGERILTFSPTQYGIKDGAVPDSSISRTIASNGSEYVSVALPKPTIKERFAGATVTNSAESKAKEVLQEAPPEAAPGVIGATESHMVPLTNQQGGVSPASAIAAQTEQQYRAGASKPGPSPETKPGLNQGQAKQKAGGQQAKGNAPLGQEILYRREVEEILTPELDSIVHAIAPDEQKQEEAKKKKKREEEDALHRDGEEKDRRSAVEEDERVNLAPILKESLKKHRNKASRKGKNKRK